MESHSHVAAWRQKGTAMTNRREGALRAVFALCWTLAMGGCGSVRYPTHYVLNFEPSVPAPAPARSTGTVAVVELGCPDYLCADRIVYRPTPTEVGFYEYHRWAVSPREMIAHHLADRVRARSLFASVSDGDSRLATDFVLNGTIDRLEEVDEGRRVAAVCALSAQLRDTRTGSIVWRDTITERVAVEQRDVAGLVNGLTTAARNSVDRLVADMELELGRSAALPCVDSRTCVSTHPR
jgi:ABC-type uncharacterized transport system auxiliary subunit